MPRTRPGAFGFAAIACLFASTGYGATFTYVGSLNGPAENPPVASPGTGTATVIYDDVAQTLSLNISFSGLIGTTTAAHIHCCVAPPGTVGVATQTPSFAGFPLGVTAGVFSNTFDLTLASSFSATFITNNGGTPAGAEAALAAGLAAGQAYLNVHTTFAPGGEIRSFLAQQVTPVPAVTGTGLAILVALLAVAGVIAVRRT